MNTKESNLLNALGDNFIKVHFPTSEEIFSVQMLEQSQGGSSMPIDYTTLKGKNVSEFITNNLNQTNYDSKLKANYQSFLERQPSLSIKFHKDILWTQMVNY